MKCPLPRTLGTFAAPLLAAFAVYSCGDEPAARVAVAPSPPPSSQFQVDEPSLGAAGAASTQCQEETREGVALGLDIYLMVDSSGSMEDLLPAQAGASNVTKWQAVQDALTAFIAAPQTADIGVGLQFFPQVQAGVPFSCNDNGDCGAAGGACSNSRCVQSGTGRLPSGESVSLLRAASDAPCLDDTDCSGPGQSCRPILGQCIYTPGDFDFPEGSLLPAGVPALCSGPNDCASLPGSICEQVGVCDRPIDGERPACTRSFGCGGAAIPCSRTAHTCSEQTLCSVPEYAAAAVPVRRDAERASDLLAALASRERVGPTPTGPALQGALEYARLWAAEHSDRQVITVLVTDGFPTDCSPLSIPDIAGIAETANRGAQPVHTFFVGVLSDEDLGFDGVDRLDTLARAGGSERSVVINTAGDVAEEMLKALNAIRDASARCNFQLGEGLDLARVNLQTVDSAGTTTELLNVGNAADCGTEQGWFYEADASGIRRQITVCPSTCRQFIAGGVRANLQIGCATRLR